MRVFQLELDGQKVKVWAEKINGKLWYHLNGETRSYQPEVKYAGSSSQKVQVHPGVIVAPMPGKIIKVNGVAGQRVTAGSVVVTMEAMKMEYALEADIDGVVEPHTLQVGSQVTLGQVLIKIKGDSSHES